VHLFIGYVGQNPTTMGLIRLVALLLHLIPVVIVSVDAIEGINFVGPPWHSSFTLQDNTTLIGWNDDNYRLASSAPSLCFSIDGKAGLHCIKTQNIYQALPFQLSQGEHLLHVSKDMSTTPDQIAIYVEPRRHDDGLKVMFLSPTYGTNIELDDLESEIAKTTLAVFFSIIDMNSTFEDVPSSQDKLLPPNTMMVVGLSGQGEFIVKENTNNFVLSGIEPGTHRITAQILDSHTRLPLGSKTELVFDAILSPRVLARHQYQVLNQQQQKRIFTKGDDLHITTATTPPMKKDNERKTPPISSSSSLKSIFGQLFKVDVGEKGEVHSNANEKPESSNNSSHKKIKLCFVGSLKYDGQRAIWLHQMKLLKKEEFDISMVTFSRDNMDQPVIDLLQEYNIRLIKAPFPPVQTEEIAQSLARHYNDHISAYSKQQSNRGEDSASDSDSKYPFWLNEARKSSGYGGDLTEDELYELIPSRSDALNHVKNRT
jgi:hypothetical protein